MTQRPLRSRSTATRRAITRVTFSASRSSSAPAIAAAGGGVSLGATIAAGFGPTGADGTGGVREKDGAANRGVSPKEIGSTIGAPGGAPAGNSGTTLVRASGARFAPVPDGKAEPEGDNATRASISRPARGTRSSRTLGIAATEAASEPEPRSAFRSSDESVARRGAGDRPGSADTATLSSLPCAGITRKALRGWQQEH